MVACHHTNTNAPIDLTSFDCRAHPLHSLRVFVFSGRGAGRPGQHGRPVRERAQGPAGTVCVVGHRHTFRCACLFMAYCSKLGRAACCLALFENVRKDQQVLATSSSILPMYGLDFAHRTVFFRLGKHRVGQLPERYFFHPPPYISKRALRAPSGIASKTRVLFAVSGGGVACPWTILFRGIPGGKNRN